MESLIEEYDTERVPNDWELKQLGEIADIVGGGTPSTFIPEYWNGDINWFTPTEIGLSKYSFESSRKITRKGLENSSAKVLPEGAILLTSRAAIGDVSILMKEGCTNQGFQSLIAKKGVNNEYLYYLVSTLKRIFLQNASGSTFLEISPKKVKSVIVSVPQSQEEQTAIATALSDTDALIENLEKLIAKKRNIKQGVMQELLKPKSNWVLTSVGEVAKICKGEQLNKDTLAAQGQYPVMNGGIQPSGYSDKWNQNPNTIIISEGGNSCGYVNFIKTRFWQGGHCYSVDAKIHKHFLFHLLKFHEKEIMALRVGSGLPNIQRNRLIEFSLRIPDKENQHKIATVLDEISEEIIAMEHKLLKYSMIKHGMMQALLTGKIRLV
ncbi:MAG: restriction endonuclease subunit S [Thermotogaceae bacterium]|nr:restriction endonuclease subunit S [Thermotogaceae bacterium]